MTVNVCFIGLFASLVLSVVSSKPLFNLTPVQVNEGSEIRLNCTAQLSKPQVVEFYRNNVIHISVVVTNDLIKSVCLSEPCSILNCTVNTSVQEYVCRIGNLSRNNHRDNWKCQHNNTASVIRTVNVIVQVQNASITNNVTGVASLREHEQLSLTCEARNGLPPANISWFLFNQTQTSNALDISDYALVREHNCSDKTITVVSVLSYNVSKAENRMYLYCVASNFAGITLSSRKICLDVKYEPETTILINQQTEDIPFYIIRNAGTRQALECRVNGGNPLAVLSWACHDGKQTDNNTAFSAISTVTWNATYLNDFKCICNASHILGWSTQRVVNVTVYYEPSPPNCTIGNKNVSHGTVNVTLDSDVNITCIADGKPPPNNFDWISPTKGITEDQTLLLPNVQVTQGGKYLFSVENTMTPSIGENITGRSNTTLDIVLQYGPRKPIHCAINGQTITSMNVSVIRGEEINIDCFADASPPPTYVWSQSQTEQDMSIAFIHDTNIECNISNILYPTGFKKKKESELVQLSIDVLYSPNVPVLKFYTCNKSFEAMESVQVIAGQPLNVTCFADAKPEPDCIWNSTHYSELLFANVTKKNSSTYVCNARNTLNISYGKSINGQNRSSFYLDVLYPPLITNYMVNWVAVEGTNFNISCKVSPGNPTETSFLWTNQFKATSETDAELIVFPNISRTDEGNFTCSASNKMRPTGCADEYVDGIDTLNFNVDVQYTASVTTFIALNTTVVHGDNLTFECDVDSDPPADINIVSPTGSIVTNIPGDNQLHYMKTSSCLEDSGQFTCVSANKHNRKEPDRRNVTVDVLCSPLYPSAYNRNTTINTRLGGTAVLNFIVFANPPPTNFTWKNINTQNHIGTFSSDRFIINSTQTTDDKNQWKSVLIIRSVASRDYGNYSVTVENEIGNKSEMFRIVEDIVEDSIKVKPNDGDITKIIVGVIVGIMLAVVLIILIIIVRNKRVKATKGRHHHNDNNKLKLLKKPCQGSIEMETSFDNVLPVNDETPKYEEEKNIYGNIKTKDVLGKSLSIKTLRDTVRKLKLDPVPLFKEFYTLQMGLKYDTKDALKPNNVAKNRYRSVYPYDASRVAIPLLRGDEDSDFINASYIDGYCTPRKYIAAQGPLENTINDTWRMIQSEDIKLIVMVTNLMETGKRKCVKYWPDDRDTYGKCNVRLDQVEEYADFVVRHFTYSMEETRFERQLIQFHYTSWPDKNVPATALSLVQFWRKVRQCKFVENTPWMVHCSAGVGRTGTFIALDYFYDLGKVDGKLNVPETVNVLREQRISMVQTKEQYLYLHEAITELLDPVGQMFDPENSMILQSTVKEDKKLNKEFKAITDSFVNVKTEENDYDLNRMPDGLLPENMCKSIDINVIPDDMYRPMLSSGNDFINAVYIPTYRESEKYIVTQFPLQSSDVDFVRLLWDQNVRDVVLLDNEDDKRHCYWPHNKNPLCLGPYIISLVSMDESTICTTRRLDISLAEKRQSKQTVVHQFTAWPGYLNLCEPKSLADFLQTISRIAGPVVVQCHDGYTRSGVFAALLCIVDRSKSDKEVAIADTIRIVKHRRQAAVTDVEQYKFCHEVVFEYLKSREGHAEENENQEYVNMTFPKFL